MKITTALGSSVLLAASLLVTVGSSPAQAYCRPYSSWKWPSASVAVNGDVGWNSTTRGFINDMLNGWDNVTPSRLAHATPAWLTSIPGQATGLKLVQERFDGDNSAPAQAQGSDSSNHSTVRLVYSTNTSRWLWSNTAHGPNKSSGQVTTDIRTVTIHEAGHGVGLFHVQCSDGTVTSAEASSVMYVDWKMRRALGSDDINGLNSIGY